MLNAIAKE